MGKHTKAILQPQDQCLAKAYNGKEKTAEGRYGVFKRCSHPKAPGSPYCTRHVDERKRKHGDWQDQVPQLEAAAALPPQPAAPALPPQPAAPPRAFAPEGFLAPAKQLPAWPVQHLLALLPEPWEEFLLKKSAKPKTKAKAKAGPAKAPALAPPSEPPAKKQKIISDADVAALVELASASSKQANQAKAYADFCKAASDELLGLPDIGVLTATKQGQMYLSEMGVLAYLKQLSKASPISTVAGKFSSLKAGIRALGLPAGTMPFWMGAKQEAPSLIAKHLKGEKVAHLEDEKPAIKQGFITRDQLLSYVLDMIALDMSGQVLSAKTIQDLFMLWVEGGRAHRLTSIRSIKWSMTGVVHAAAGHAAAPAPDQPFLIIPSTKGLGNMSGQQAVKAKCLIKFYLGDPVSQYLFKAWQGVVPEDKQEEAGSYFFPHQGQGDFDYTQSASNSCFNAAVLRCAEHLGLVLNEEHAQTFGANSIRSGIAAEVKTKLEQELGKLNLQHGRAAKSDIDIHGYCPQEVLVEPGLLYTDVAAIEAAWAEKMQQHTMANKDSLLCKICGYPNCKCVRCSLLAQGKPCSSSKQHVECWLAGRTPGKKSKNWIAEAPDQLQARADAWAACGIYDLPVFQDGKFAWME